MQAMGGVCLSVCRFVMNVAERNTEDERELHVAACCMLLKLRHFRVSLFQLFADLPH